MFIVKVKGVGNGLGFNSYPIDFTFTMNGLRSDWEDDEIKARAIRKAKDNSGCDSVTIKSISFEEVM